MPRTTLNLDAAILRELRDRGALEGKSLGQVASELLAGALATPPASATGEPTWAAWDLGTPRLDLEDKEAVRRALEGPP